MHRIHSLYRTEFEAQTGGAGRAPSPCALRDL